MNPRAYIFLFHILFVAPLLLFIGIKKYKTPNQLYTFLIILGIVVLFYHLFMLYNNITNVSDDDEHVRNKMNSCNQNDMKILNDQKLIEKSFMNCSAGCIFTSNPSQCTKSCMQNKTQLSGLCSQCFGDQINCISNNCSLPCLNPSSNACNKCIKNKCIPLLLKCLA